MDDAKIVHLIRELLPETVAIYRFGSSVHGTTHPQSDIDLAVLLPKPLPALQRFDVQERLATILHRSVDLVDLRAASTVMQKMVLATGIVTAVFEKTATDRFETYVLSAYARLNEERREILEQVKRERSVHG